MSVPATLCHALCSLRCLLATVFFHRHEGAARSAGTLDRPLTFSSPPAYSCNFSQAKAPPAIGARGIRILRYLFEEYAFDTDRRELHRGADAVSIAPQVFDLLDYL